MIYKNLISNRIQLLSITINFVHGEHMNHIDIDVRVAAAPGPLATALGPLACPSHRVIF